MKGDHARFTWGLVSDIKKFMLNKNERVAFTSIVMTKCLLNLKISRCSLVL